MLQTESPLERIVSTECEYTLQPGLKPSGGSERAKYSIKDYLNKDVLNTAGLSYVQLGGNSEVYFMGEEGGSGKLYIDGRLIEFAACEALGAASAAIFDREGAGIVRRVLHASGLPHNGLYRFSGVVGMGSGEQGIVEATTGYHPNFMAHRRVMETRLRGLFATFQLSCLWAMKGAVRSDGFVFSQKAWGMGTGVIRDNYEDEYMPTIHGAKPMVAIRTAEHDDTMCDDEYVRVEYRFAEPGQSLVCSYATLALKSLLTRVVEDKGVWEKPKLQGLAFRKPELAARTFASDLTLQRVATLENGKHETALSMQARLFDIMQDYIDSHRVLIPPQEIVALEVGRAANDALRASKPAERDYTPEALRRVEFAPAHMYIADSLEAHEVIVQNKDVRNRFLLWNRVDPDGVAMRYWQAVETNDPVVAQVYAFHEKAGRAGRAILRAGLIDNADTAKYRPLNWTAVRDQDVVRLLRPYDQQLP